MRTLPLALGLTLLALVSSPGPTGAPSVSAAVAQTPEDLYRKCARPCSENMGTGKRETGAGSSRCRRAQRPNRSTNALPMADASYEAPGLRVLGSGGSRRGTELGPVTGLSQVALAR